MHSCLATDVQQPPHARTLSSLHHCTRFILDRYTYTSRTLNCYRNIIEQSIHKIQKYFSFLFVLFWRDFDVEGQLIYYLMDAPLFRFLVPPPLDDTAYAAASNSLMAIPCDAFSQCRLSNVGAPLG